MKKVKQLIKKNEPFAVIMYYETLSFDKNVSCKAYELIYINKSNSLCVKVLNYKDIFYIKSLGNKLNLVVENEHGEVREFCDFKKHKESIIN